MSLLPLTHKGRRPGRLRKYQEYVNAERFYAAGWLRMQRDHEHLLHRLLAPEGREFGSVSPRDAEVAATIIQWLGTNVGTAFVRSTEARIAEARDDRFSQRIAAWHEEQRRFAQQRVDIEPVAKTRLMDVE